MKKKTTWFILLAIAVIAAIFLYMQWTLKPLPEAKRNQSTTDITMIVGVRDTADRTPIIRTYTLDEYDAMDSKQIARVREVVNGNIEGDVPAVKLENGRSRIDFSFADTSDGRNAVPIIPDTVPDIRITSLETLYSEEEPVELSDTLAEGEKEGSYYYTIQRYQNFEGKSLDGNEEFYVEALYIEIQFVIDGESYVSLFAINTLEAR